MPGKSVRQIVRELNPHARIIRRGDVFYVFEDVKDSDGPNGRYYSIEYKCTAPDGAHAIAFCRYNPHAPTDPTAGKSHMDFHVSGNGFICLGKGATEKLLASPFSLEEAIEKARYWCIAMSYALERGCAFPQPSGG